MKLWLYRTSENDEDGDPMDFGVLRADTVGEARKYINAHLKHLWPDDPLLEYWVYELLDVGQSGMIHSRTRFNPNTKD
jgi:hypothetical protein